MKIQFLGTAAAEGIPALFCQCPVCRQARAAGGKEIRTRSGAIIDGKLKLDFGYDPICFGQVRAEHGLPYKEGTVLAQLAQKAKRGDHDFRDVAGRIVGDTNSYFSAKLVYDEEVSYTITSAGNFTRFYDKMEFADLDFIRCQTFPWDYQFGSNEVQYVCGMSVPPNMMANIATEVYEQWLKK